MSNRYACILAAGCASVLVAGLGVTTALAATTAKTWTVQPGGAITATSGKVTVEDTENLQTFACHAATASGTLRSGSGLPGARAGSLSAVGFTECSGPGGPKFALQATDLPWHVNLSSYNAAKGLVWGAVSKIHIVVSGCASAVIDGTSGTAHDGRVRFRYTDSTGQLTMLTTGGNLHFYNVTNSCLGSVNPGDPVTLNATFTVSPKQTITSP